MQFFFYIFNLIFDIVSHSKLALYFWIINVIEWNEAFQEHRSSSSFLGAIEELRCRVVGFSMEKLCFTQMEINKRKHYSTGSG